MHNLVVNSLAVAYLAANTYAIVKVGVFELARSRSRSSVGETLRRHMTIEKWEDVKLPGAIWPKTASVKSILQVIAKEDHHVVAIMDGDPPVLLVSLFGEYDAFLPLGTLAEGRLPTTSGEGTVWRIELPNRKLSKLTMTALIGERSEEARRRAREALDL